MPPLHLRYSPVGGEINVCLFFFVFSLTNLVLAIHPHGEDHVGVGEEELHLVQRLLGLAVRPSSKFVAGNAGTLLIYQSYCKVPHGLRLGIFVFMQVCLILFVFLSLFPVFFGIWDPPYSSRLYSHTSGRKS